MVKMNCSRVKIIFSQPIQTRWNDVLRRL